jgi:hypothetical protein
VISFILLNRKLLAAIIQNSDALLDLSMTPPAPPLTVAQQRCVALLRAVDLKNKELKVEADYDPNMYCNYFLSEVSHLMFQPMSKLTVFKRKSKFIVANYELTLFCILVGRNECIGSYIHGCVSISRNAAKSPSVPL